jgi:glycosyltransferase involved in cell wall biosynthesis
MNAVAVATEPSARRLRIAWVYRHFNSHGSIPSLYFRDAQLLARDEDVTLVCATSTREATLQPMRFEAVEPLVLGTGRLSYAAECLSFARRASRVITRLRDHVDVVHVEGTAATSADMVRVHAVRPAEIDHYFRVVAPRSPVRRRIAPFILRPQGGVVMSIERRLYQSRPLCVVPSRAVKADLEFHYDVLPELIEVIPYGVDTKRIRFDAAGRAALRAELGVPATRFVSLVVATDFERKGVARAIDAFAASGVDGELWVIGGDDPTSYLRRAREAGVGERVRFLGRQPVGDLPKWYSAADALIALSDQDSWAMTVVEALAVGRVVIASEYTGSHEAIDHQRSGFVVGGAGNPSEVADLLSRIAAEPERRQAMMAAACEVALDYDLDVVFPRYRRAVHRAHDLRLRRLAGGFVNAPIPAV